MTMTLGVFIFHVWPVWITSYDVNGFKVDLRVPIQASLNDLICLGRV